MSARKPKRRTLTIMGRPYSLTLARTAEEGEALKVKGCYGVTNIEAKTIVINVYRCKKNSVSVEGTLIHEVVHAILAETGLSEWMIKLDTSGGIEEALVVALENGLTPLVGVNKEVGALLK